MSNRTHKDVVRLVKQELDNGGFDIQRTENVPACSWKELEPTPSTPIWSNQEWTSYSYRALDLFQLALEGKHTPNWNDVKFRAESCFVAGSFNRMIRIWPILINQLPEKMRSEAYHTLFYGVSLFDNLRYIKEREAITFRKEKLATFYTKNEQFARLKFLKAPTSNPDQIQSGDYVIARRVLYPGFASCNKRKKSFRVKNPPGLVKHFEVVLKQIKKWVQTGALEVVPNDLANPLLASAIIVVPKQGPEQWRVCYDGSPVKAVESYTQPCHLDSCGDVLKVLKKGDLLVKMDDKQGFHQLLLDEQSRELAYCSFGDQYFRYRGAAFGFPKIPGIYQLINGIPVNVLRRHGIRVFLYLDDRLFIIRPKNKQHREDLLAGKVAPLGPYLGALLMTAVGTVINRPKSVLTPLEIMDFLGFTFNTIKGTIKIPKDKWEAFKKEAASIRNLSAVGFKRLERIRGKCASFAIVVKNMRLYIRRLTDELVEHAGEFLIPVSDELKDELLAWIQAKYIARERSWILPGITSVTLEISTDASNFACGVVIKSLGIEETVYWKEDGDITSGDIFLKEAFAILYVLRCYGHKFINRRIHFLNDNQAVCKTFETGSRKKAVNSVLREIHETANKYNIELEISWVPTTEQEADAASRTIDVKEAIFRKGNFLKLEKRLGIKFTLDSMATRQNSKCKQFISLRPVDGSFGSDFLAQTYFGKHNLWVFPPKVLTLVVFQALLRNARKNFWCLIIMDYETLNPVWSEITSNPDFEIIEDLGDTPVLFPSKELTTFGYWKVPKKAKISAVIHRPASLKRNLMY